MSYHQFICDDGANDYFDDTINPENTKRNDKVIIMYQQRCKGPLERLTHLLLVPWMGLHWFR